MNYNSLLTAVEIILKNDLATKEKLLQICELLQAKISYYDWVGFYFANFTDNTLHLTAFSGEPTDHTIIPFGKGICGQVAVSNKNFVVPDVLLQDNYIACSTTVRSEIVIPIWVNQKNIGQIDIDSHTIDAFSNKDEIFLEKVCGLVGTYLSDHPLND